ncbi:hypothetical protein SCA6_019403 [Theobroma cacao]
MLLSLPSNVDFVIWAVASKDLKLEKIQDEIGEKIGYSDNRWRNKRIEQKAIDIYRVLSNRKFVLLLDDLWDRVDLTKIGVPIPDQQNNSKVVFTTRSKETPSTPQNPVTPVTPQPKPTASGWCVPKAGISDAQLQASLDYACSQGIDCGPIQPGGACFEPNTVASHVAYAMNLYYQTAGKNLWNCDFSQTATVTSQNPNDIWERVDLSKVGIPSPTQENGSKLIFTTCSVEVCGQMRADKKIEVTCLPEEKAWQLFEEHVGKDLFDSHPNIRDLAQEVAKECGGLPLALITIGRAMACKTTYEEWKYAIEVLRRSSATSIFQGMGEEVYPLLKYSFDSLSSDMVRSCLLYCSLFSEDSWIRKERLIDCWIGEGFLDERDNISQARNQGHHIIGSLIHACLLEEVEDEIIKMHDVIRDMCLWIDY